MTAAPMPSSSPIAHPLVVMRPGMLVWTWCSKCMQRTDHRYQPGTKTPLKCVECEKAEQP